MVRPKKHLGQHFLRNESTAERIAQALGSDPSANILEIGPGTGALTKKLLDIPHKNLYLVDLDKESILYLQAHFSERADILWHDVLTLDIPKLVAGEQILVVGNFPYNISSQIIFKLLENHALMPCLVGTFQYELARRLVASPGSKEYGVISVLLRVLYEPHFLFSIEKEEFFPPPKVKSAVVKLVRRQQPLVPIPQLPHFTQLVKAAFSMRRKMLKNNLQSFDLTRVRATELLRRRAETLGIEEFYGLLLDLQNPA